jgi:hypothetical protein
MRGLAGGKCTMAAPGQGSRRHGPKDHTGTFYPPHAVSSAGLGDGHQGAIASRQGNRLGEGPSHEPVSARMPVSSSPKLPASPARTGRQDAAHWYGYSSRPRGLRMACRKEGGGHHRDKRMSLEMEPHSALILPDRTAWARDHGRHGGQRPSSTRAQPGTRWSEWYVRESSPRMWTV